MFHFSRLELVHWDYWQRVMVPLDGRIVTIVGPNGSGKTTLLDALRTLLATKCSAKREYKRYVRRNGAAFAWLRAVVDNRRSGGGRYPHPFWPLMDDEVTIACRIRKQGGDWLRQYAIEAGDVSIEELETKATWLGVEDYRRRLESAGLSKAIIEVLALEQGDTDKLCEYSPKQLLELVFHVFGDKEVLDAYLQAKTEQKEAERELKDMQNDLSSLELQYQTAIGKANRYLEWQQLKNDQLKLVGEVLPCLQASEMQSEIDDNHSRIESLQVIQSEKQTTIKKVQQQRAEVENLLASSEERQSNVNAAWQTSQTQLKNARDSLRDAENKLKERERLIDYAKKKQNIDVETIAASIGKHRQEQARAEASLENSEARKKEIAKLISALASGQNIPPEFVRNYRQALRDANISNCMLNEIVEVTDPTWQVALEALMQPYKHIVLLSDPSDRESAWRLAEQLKYRHFVVVDRKPIAQIQPNSVLSVVDFKQDPPEWLIQLLNKTRLVEDVKSGAKLPKEQDWITRDGYHRERRGGRYIGVERSEFHFGEAARKEQIEALRNEASSIEKNLPGLQERINYLRKTISDEQLMIAGVDAAEILAARSEEFAAVENQLSKLEKQVKDADEVSTQKFTERDKVLGEVSKLDIQKNDLAGYLKALQNELTQKESELTSLRNIQTEQSAQLTKLTEKLPEHWLSPEHLQVLRDDYNSVANVKFTIKKIDEKLETSEWETDPRSLDIRDKFKGDVEAKNAEVLQRQGYYNRANHLAYDARDAYINVLRATVKRYNRNLRGLGELAGIEVQADPPELVNEDLALAQAGLVVKFNFDKKGLMGLNDGEASGGQQVMKSLILLIALMMDEDRPGGFVFVDEPFAHLDIFNIDRVSTFLQATKAQYLITTPNTHNINIFNPTELTLVTRKRQPGDDWAQPVAVVRKMVDNEVTV